MKRLVIAPLVLYLAGCATQSTNMRIGNEQTYTSLEAQRQAVLKVAESETLPANAAATGPVDASRYHRYQGDIEPSNEILMDDLKAAAFARGADGIFGVQIAKEGALTRNCWHSITARATMYRLAK